MESLAATRIGAKLLKEIEEDSLNEALNSLRADFKARTLSKANGAPRLAISRVQRLSSFPIEALNDLIDRHARATQIATTAPLAVSGRYLPLLYYLVATLIVPPHNQAVLVVDMEGKFNVTSLVGMKPYHGQPARAKEVETRGEGQAVGTGDTSARETAVGVSPEDLRHVYVLCPVLGSNLRTRAAESIRQAERFMLYGTHGSRHREWWGTIVIGGGTNHLGSTTWAYSTPWREAQHVMVAAGWKGWLRVERQEVPGFGDGVVSVEEALRDRDKRQQAVDQAGWVAWSAWGNFAFEA